MYCVLSMGHRQAEQNQMRRLCLIKSIWLKWVQWRSTQDVARAIYSNKQFQYWRTMIFDHLTNNLQEAQYVYKAYLSCFLREDLLKLSLL